jgi:hypothetical protein
MVAVSHHDYAYPLIDLTLIISPLKTVSGYLIVSLRLRPGEGKQFVLGALYRFLTLLQL